MLDFAICSLASGSSGNCYIVKARSTVLLIDAGISARRIQRGLARVGLAVEDVDGVLLTHEHSDHVCGLATLTKRNDVTLYANEGTYRGIGLAEGMHSHRSFRTGEQFEIGDVTVRTFGVSHDAADPVGFSILYGERCITIITDTGIVDGSLLGEIRASDILVLESNHEESLLRIGRYPAFLKRRIASDVGHLSNKAAAQALASAMHLDGQSGNGKPKRVLLAHLSQSNNLPELALITMENVLEERGIETGKRIRLNALPREDVSPFYGV